MSEIARLRARLAELDAEREHIEPRLAELRGRARPLLDEASQIAEHQPHALSGAEKIAFLRG